jgi:glycosyltransferase involved in cell wall biosynthesis
MTAVTIGLPFHDDGDSLADAIRSVFAQTFTDWELLLVDDGSNDNSLELARRVRDPRVHVLSDGEQRRLPARLNQIVDAARGDLIARLDADDMMHPERLARQVQLLAEQGSIDLVGTACFTLGVHDEVMGVVASEPLRTDPHHVLRRGPLMHATLLCRRAWCHANRYDERFPRAEDRELFCRTRGAARLALIRDPLYFIGYRKDPIRTLRDYVASSRDCRRIFLEYAPRLAIPVAMAPFILESFAKEAVFRVVTALGRQDILLRRRGRRATAEERELALAVLRRIRTTRVEGLDHYR